MDIIFFVILFLILIFFLYIGLKNYDGWYLGFLFAALSLLILSGMLYASGIQVENGAIINHAGGVISSIVFNLSTTSASKLALY